MKSISNQVYKLATLLVLLLFVNCQKEDISNALQSETQNKDATTKTVSAKDIPDVINFIQSKSNDRLEFSFDNGDTPTFSGTNDPHETDIVITQAMEDDIVQVINDGKSNYAFKTTQRNPSYFLNLIVVETPDDFYMYFAKYVPSLETYWDGKSLDDFEGTMYVYSDTGKFREKSYFANNTRGLVPCECAIGGGGEDGCHEEAWYICGFRGSLHQNESDCNCWNSDEGCSGFTVVFVTVCSTGDKSVEPSSINKTYEECYCWVDDGTSGGIGGGTGGGNNNNCPNAQPCENELEEYNDDCECELFLNPITPINPTPNYGKDINTCLGGIFTLDEINTLNDNPTVDQLYNYLFDDNGNCNPENPEFAELAAEALLEGGEFDEDDNVILSSEFKNNEKLKCVFDKLASDGSNLFKETIGAFIDNPNVNLIFTIGDCATTNDACTQDSYVDETGIITVKIEDISATPIELAQLIIHEAIHAELAKYVSEFESGIDSNNRSYLFHLYKFYKDSESGGNIDHIYMTMNYINPMASALREFDNNSYPLDYYKSFVWEGLTKWDVNNAITTDLLDNYYEYRPTVLENSNVCN